MEGFTIALKNHLEDDRSWTKIMFKVAGTIYRGVNKKRVTLEKAFKELDAKY